MEISLLSIGVKGRLRKFSSLISSSTLISGLIIRKVAVTLELLVDKSLIG